MQDLNNYTGIVKFWNKRCAPCKTIKDILLEVVSELEISIVEIDTDNDPHNQVQKYGIKSVPTVLYIDNGVIRNVIVGAKKKESYLEIINSSRVLENA